MITSCQTTPVIVDVEAVTPDVLPALRAELLATRREERPAALLVRLSSAPDETACRTIGELLQYVDLCVTDRRSAAWLGVENETEHPDMAAALVRKLVKRFALGGVVLPDEGYAWLNTPAAQQIYPAVAHR